MSIKNATGLLLAITLATASQLSGGTPLVEFDLANHSSSQVPLPGMFHNGAGSYLAVQAMQAADVDTSGSGSFPNNLPGNGDYFASLWPAPLDPVTGGYFHTVISCTAAWTPEELQFSLYVFNSDNIDGPRWWQTYASTDGFATWTLLGNVLTPTPDLQTTYSLDLGELGQLPANTDLELRWVACHWGEAVQRGGFSNRNDLPGAGSNIIVVGTMVLPNPEPEIDVQGQGWSIAGDGSNTTGTLDDTDFGSSSVGVPTAEHTFVIENSGSADLNITSVVIGGAHPDDFAVTTPASATVSAAGSTNLGITFDPTAIGLRTATVTIDSDDSDEGTYAFNIQGSANGPETTGWPDTEVPGVVDVGPEPAAELGVKIRTDLAGTIRGIRFYQAAANTGPHVGNLWAEDGTLLASATFATDPGTGWRQVNFATPVEIEAGTVYVASYHCPNGHYSRNLDFFTTTGVSNGPLHFPADPEAGGNGVYVYSASSAFPNLASRASNYWVDVVFQAGPAPPPPVLNSVTMSPVDPTIPMGGMQPFTATGAYSDGSSQDVTSQVAWSSSDTGVATVDGSGLASGVSTGTAVITADMNGASDSAILTVEAAAEAISIWPDTTVPGVADIGPEAPVELGVKFRTDVEGSISGIRFYQAAANTGPHVGNLWTDDGTLLASATFATEPGTGWRQVNFGTPVAVSPDTLYVASYHCPNGHYSRDLDFFEAGGVSNGPLHFPGNGEGGGNGVYGYGAGSAFPTQSSRASNYWVDVVLQTVAEGFTIITYDTVQTVGLNDTVSFNLGYSPIGGFTGSMTATVSALPADATGVFEPVVVPHPGPFALDVTTQATTPPGIYQLQISGADFDTGLITAEATVQLNVTSTPDLRVVLEPDTVLLAQGSSGIVTYQIESLNGFDQAVTLDATGLPGGVTVSFDPPGVVPPGAGTLTIEAGFGVAPGIYPVTVGITGGGLTREAVFDLTVFELGSGSWRQLALGDAGVRHYGAIVGDVGDTGQNRVYASGGSGVLVEYAFDGNAWSFSQLPVGVPSDGEMHNMAIGDGRGDGVARLYVAAYEGGKLYELSWVGGAWEVEIVDDTIQGSTDASIADGRNDGNLRIYLAFDLGVYEYTWTGSGWQRVTVDASADGPAHGIDVGFGRNDGLNRVYTASQNNGDLYEYSWDGAAWLRQLIDNIGDARNCELGEGRNDGVFRLYAAGGDGKVYEYTWNGAIWQELDMGNAGTEGVKVHAIPESAKGDGQMRIYVPSSDAGVYEFTWTGTEWSTEVLGFANAYMYGLETGDGLNNGGVQVYGSSYDGNAYLFEWVPAGPPPVEVPDVIEVSQAAAESAITDAGLTVGAVTASTSATVPAGDVISQSPAGGTLVAPGTPVGLVVSAGPELSALVVAPVGRTIAIGSTQPFTATGSYSDGSFQDATSQVAWGSMDTSVATIDGSGLASGLSAGSTTITATLDGVSDSTTLTVISLEPVSIWAETDVPGVVDNGPEAPVELGVKFRADVPGTVTGIRFYKSAANTGTHVGSLWSTGGSLLASAIFTAETASGWQQVDFPTPVAIAANTVYVASCHCPNGHYSRDPNFFAAGGVSNGPLHLLGDGEGGGNGVFGYGAGSVFPTTSDAASNYWVDVVFRADFPVPPPPVLQILGLEVIPAAPTQEIVVRWQVANGTNPFLERSDELETWMPVADEPTLVGIGQWETHLNVPLSESRLFFRVRDDND